jgi:putative spermidine/putrescine transport system permease protein
MSERRPGLGFAVVVCLAWVALLFLVLPMIVVVPISLTPERYLSLPHGGISVKHYAALVTDESWYHSIFHSVFVASAASALAILFGTLGAIGCWRIASRWSELARAVMLAPMIVPAIVHALGFYRVWTAWGLLDTFPGLIIAHAAKSLPYVLITVSASLANFDPRLEQAARNLGASLWQTIRWVIVPSILPGMMAGGFFAFTLSWDEIVVALFITSRHVYTLPRRIWDGIQDNIDPAVGAVATILVALTFCLLAAHFARQRRLAARLALPPEPELRRRAA